MAAEVASCEMDQEDVQAEEQEPKKKQNQVDPSIQCLFSRKPCKRKRLRGFDFCHKHILEDKNSPFQQCSFIIKSTEDRCTNPAPKSDNKKTFCLIHTRDPKLKKAHDEIMRRNMKRKLAQRKASSEAKRALSESSTSSNTQRPSSQEGKRPRESESENSAALEVPDSDSIYALQDNEAMRHDVAWFGENESDAESVDSEEEDPLRHAGAWTLEEALKICKDKMIRKRSLYLEQYKRLHLLLKERRRRHLLRMASISYPVDPAETIGDSNEPPLPVSEQRALGLYQHINGIEALLEKQAKDKRARGSLAPKTVPQNRCQHADYNQRCQNRVLPFSKFCLQHICFDPDQWLYKHCTFGESSPPGSCCSLPVPQVARTTMCDLHAMPLQRFSSDALDNIINPVEKSESSANGQSEGMDTNEATKEAEGQTGDSKEIDQKIAGSTDEAKPIDVTVKPELAEGAVTNKTNDDKDSDAVMKDEEQSALKNTDLDSDNIKLEDNIERPKDGRIQSVLPDSRPVARGDEVSGVPTPEVKQLGLNETNPPINTAMGQVDIEMTSPATIANDNPHKTSTNDSEFTTVSEEDVDSLNKDNCGKNYADSEKSSAKDTIKNNDNVQL